MATVTASLEKTAESIFSDLGYVVEPDGPELRAKRKWRVVQVTPLDTPDEAPRSGDLRCFVTWRHRADEVRERLASSELDYEWAVMGVEENGDYEVHHAPQSSLAA